MWPMRSRYKEIRAQEGSGYGVSEAAPEDYFRRAGVFFTGKIAALLGDFSSRAHQTFPFMVLARVHGQENSMVPRKKSREPWIRCADGAAAFLRRSSTVKPGRKTVCCYIQPGHPGLVSREIAEWRSANARCDSSAAAGSRPIVAVPGDKFLGQEIMKSETSTKLI